METRKHFSKLGLVLFICTILVYGVQFLAIAILEGTTAGAALANNTNLHFLALMLPMYLIAYPITYWLFSKIPASHGEPKKMSFWKMVAAFLICYGGTYICNFIGNFITIVIGMFKQSSVTNPMLEITGSVDLWITFPIVIILAPIAEEYIFRKALMDRTIPYGEGISVLLSAILFALFHGNLNQFAYTFFMGAFFGFLYVKTRRVSYTIILHIVINFIGSFLSVIVMDISGYAKIAQMTQTGITQAELAITLEKNLPGLLLFAAYSLLLICFTIAGFIIFLVNIKKFRLHAGEQFIEKGQKFKTVFCNIGMGLFCIFWIVVTILQLFY